MLAKCKVSIKTDVVYASCEWYVYMSRETQQEHNYGLPYERCYIFVTKPNRKQLRRLRKKFKVGYDMYEYYN
jgi:hypothetical protein